MKEELIRKTNVTAPDKEELDRDVEKNDGKSAAENCGSTVGKNRRTAGYCFFCKREIPNAFEGYRRGVTLFECEHCGEITPKDIVWDRYDT